MDRSAELQRAQQPWGRPEVVGNAIVSAGLGVRHPGLCFELGDRHGDQFIPHKVVDQTLWRSKFVVALWQPHDVYLVNVQHTPERTHAMGLIGGVRPDYDSCSIRRYTRVPYGAFFVELQENIDPRSVCPELSILLRTPLGQSLSDTKLLKNTDPLCRIVVEFPGYHESADLPLDTSIGSLALLASQEYFNMTESRL